LGVEVLTVMSMNTIVFWNVISYSLAEIDISDELKTEFALIKILGCGTK
jgi:hypothetical protein